MSRNTIRSGRRELDQGGAPGGRRPGAGRPEIETAQPGPKAALEAFVDPVTRGDPTSVLRWTCKSKAKLAAALTTEGWRVSATTVGRLLHDLGYRLQALQNTLEGPSHPDRNAQFEHINATATTFLQRQPPVISVDTKKKELIGDFKTGGREWQPSGQPELVRVHDFPGDAVGEAIPYGVCDMARNEAWVSVGRDHDTPAFAVASIRQWWTMRGRRAYPGATDLYITADAGGSNGYRSRAWKAGLQRVADDLRLTIHVSPFPPGTSKWNNWIGVGTRPVSSSQRPRCMRSRSIPIPFTAIGITRCVHDQLDHSISIAGLRMLTRSKMRLHKATLLNRIAKTASRPLSRMVCSRFLESPVRALDAYLNFLMGKGSGTGWDLEHEIQAALSRVQRPNPVIFDVGANIGLWSKRLLEMAPEARVFMFEPAPECLKQIRALKLTGATLIPCALGESAGKASLHFSSATDGSASLHPRGDSYFQDRTYTSIEVEVLTLDQIIKEHRLDAVDFLKMDIEGHELSALRGAAKAMEQGRIRALSFEFGSGDINSRTFFRDFWNLLDGCGFVLHRVTPGGRLLPVPDYYEDCEYFRGATNYIAELKRRA